MRAVGSRHTLIIRTSTIIHDPPDLILLGFKGGLFQKYLLHTI